MAAETDQAERIAKVILALEYTGPGLSIGRVKRIRDTKDGPVLGARVLLNWDEFWASPADVERHGEWEDLWPFLTSTAAAVMKLSAKNGPGELSEIGRAFWAADEETLREAARIIIDTLNR
jgi:hypothetical protein